MFSSLISNIVYESTIPIEVHISKQRKHVSLYKEASIIQPGEALPGLTGLDKQREMLDQLILGFFKKGQIGIHGILLHGSSGNGKTLLGLHYGRLVQDTGLANFISVRCLDLVSKVVGETESNVARIFSRCKDSAPCLLFLDQLDALLPRLDESEPQTTERTFERVLTLFLTEIDGIQSKGYQDSIIVLAATQKITNLDPTVIRPGRIGTHVHINPPSSVNEIIELLNTCTKDMPLQSSQFFQSISERLLESKKTRAEISNMCREAAMLAFRENNVNCEVVEEKHFWKVLNTKNPFDYVVTLPNDKE